MRYFLFIIIVILAKPLASQNWEAISAKPDRPFTFLWKDTVQNLLYASGFDCSKLGNDSTYNLTSYNGSFWKPINKGLRDNSYFTGNASVLSATHYKKKILFGGYFYAADTVKQACIVLYNRTGFERFLPEPFTKKQYNVVVRTSIVFQDTLYIGGGFDSIQGKPAKGLAKLVGNNWVPIFLGTEYQDMIYKLIEYRGELYVIGGFTNSNINDGHNGILKLKNNLWQPVGGGLKGTGVNRAICAAVYNDELYMGGEFQKSSGNQGHNIQKWNGITWSDVGTTSDATMGGIWDMKVVKNKLFIYGGFDFIGDGTIPTEVGLAMWNGLNWCSSNDDIFDLNTLTALEYYNEKIIVSGIFHSINNDSTNAHLARLKCDDFCSDTCKYEIPPTYADNFTIFPNPNNGLFTINANGYVPNNATTKLYNALGQKIIDSPFMATINLQGYASGLYYLQIVMVNKTYNYKIIVE